MEEGKQRKVRSARLDLRPPKEGAPKFVLWRLPIVQRTTGLGRSRLYDMVRAGSFPAPIKLSERASAWVASEVEDWIAQRIVERDTRKAAT